MKSKLTVMRVCFESWIAFIELRKSRRMYLFREMYNLYTRNVLALRRKVFRLWVTAAFAHIRQELFVTSHMQIKAALKSFTCWQILTLTGLKRSGHANTSPPMPMLSVLENRVVNLEQIIAQTAGFAQHHTTQTKNFSNGKSGTSSFTGSSLNCDNTLLQALPTIGAITPPSPWASAGQCSFDSTPNQYVPRHLILDSSTAPLPLQQAVAQHHPGAATGAEGAPSSARASKPACPPDANPQRVPLPCNLDGTGAGAHAHPCTGNDGGSRSPPSRRGIVTNPRRAGMPLADGSDHSPATGEGEHAVIRPDSVSGDGGGGGGSGGGGGAGDSRKADSESSELQNGWRQRQSRKWGRAFYYHPTSGRSQWHRPGPEPEGDPPAAAGTAEPPPCQ
jgi:hypothetical protein